MLDEDQDDIHQQRFYYNIDITTGCVQDVFCVIRVRKKDHETGENHNQMGFEDDDDDKLAEEPKQWRNETHQN